jgi:hypothetical protein
MAVSDLSCLVCGQPAIIVIGARIEAGSANYPACEHHLAELTARMMRDAQRAIANLLARRHEVVSSETRGEVVELRPGGVRDG